MTDLTPTIKAIAPEEWERLQTELCNPYSFGQATRVRAAYKALIVKLAAAVEERDNTIRHLRVQHGDLIHCENCDKHVDPVWAEGWQRTSDDCDLCPECWTEFVQEAARDRKESES